MQPVAKRLEEIRTRNGANRQRVDSARSSAKNRARRNVEVFEFKSRNLIDQKGEKQRTVEWPLEDRIDDRKETDSQEADR